MFSSFFHQPQYIQYSNYWSKCSIFRLNDVKKLNLAQCGLVLNMHEIDADLSLGRKSIILQNHKTFGYNQHSLSSLAFDIFLFYYNKGKKKNDFFFSKFPKRP